MKKNLFMVFLPLLLISCTPNKLYILMINEPQFDINSNYTENIGHHYSTGDEIIISVTGHVDTDFFSTLTFNSSIYSLDSSLSKTPYLEFESLTANAIVEENVIKLLVNENDFDTLNQSINLKINTPGTYMIKISFYAPAKKKNYYPLDGGIGFKIIIE